MWAYIVLTVLILSQIFSVTFFYLGCRGRKYIKDHDFLKNLLIINRALSYVVFFIWIKLMFGSFFPPFNNILFIIGLIILLIGQYINWLVYNKIGTDGVYYGAEYGVVPMKILNEFPFNLKHPQYIACLLSVTGILLAIGFDPKMRPRWPVVWLWGFYVISYLVSMGECAYS